MGTVWRAADTLLRRDVAIKEVILPPGLAPSDRDSMYERTMREARAAAALQHPAVVQVYDVVHENGRPWIVMELLDARSLADMVIEDGPVSARVVAKIGIALLGALEVAHAHGVLHRDVKPANVLICSDGRCVLTDFGVARMPTDVQLTTPGMVLGSPHFISPERAMGSDFGPPSDLFSLGVTLFTAVEGRPPFDKGDPIETMHAVVEDPPTPPQRAGSLTPVLMGLLEKDPAQRMDVQTARTILRQQLAGPLASKAPPHMATDPYSVVPSQRPPAAATQAIPTQPPKPSGQIGGRAMLAPDESLSGHFAKVQEGDAPTAPISGGRRRAKEEPERLAGTMAGTSAMPGVQPNRGGDPTTVIPPRGGDRTSFMPPRRGDPTTVIPPNGGDETSVIPPRAAWNGAQAASAPMYGGAPSGGGAKAKLDSAVRTVKDSTGRAVQTVQGWPRNKQLIAGGCAVVVVLLLVLVVSLSGGGGDKASTTPQAGDGNPVPASFQTQDYADRGITVKVPKEWKRSASGEWVDYADPADPKRKVRILIEPAGGTPSSFLKVAENGLKKNSTSCPDPYSRVDLTKTSISGQDGAVLEYTCGSGDSARHGLWGAVISNKHAYSFYLTTNATQFAESKPIFDEMLKTYTLSN
jgi:serine/threonine protein kinase